MPQKGKLAIEEVIDKIIAINEVVRKFWTSAEGWAPVEASKLLNKSRLDWQVSLSKCLKIWIEKPDADDVNGRLILAWTNLGSLIEGTMKLFLSIWYNSYKENVNVIERRKKALDPDKLNLEYLRLFFKEAIWSENDKSILDDWILNIQQKRNAIHAYKDRNIGNFIELYENIREYLRFHSFINDRLPYPEETYHPSLEYHDICKRTVE